MLEERNASCATAARAPAMGRTTGGWRALVLSSGLAAATMAPGVAVAQGNDGSKSPVLIYVVPTLLQTLANLASQGMGCLLQRGLHSLGMSVKPECDTRTNEGALPGVDSEVAANLARQPVLTFVVQKLDSRERDAPVVAELIKGKLSTAQSPHFTIRTDEVFALAFTTTVPGRVQLEGANSFGEKSLSGHYEAVPGENKRIPRADQRGILMEGRTGPETIDVIFYPCVSPSLAHLPQVAPFRNVIPPCGPESATKGGTPDVIRGNGAKLPSFADSGDSTLSTAVSPSGYEKGNVLRFTIRIDHQPAQ